MIGVLGHDSVLIRLYWQGTTWANEITFVMIHAPGTGSIDRPVDKQSSALPLYHGYSPIMKEKHDMLFIL